MADGIVQVAPDSTGKKVDTSELSVGGQTVERQRVVVADPTTAANFQAVNANGEAASVCPDLTASGNITANGQTVSLAVGGRKSYAVEFTGTWVGTLVFELLVGSTWVGVDAYAEGTESFITSTTVNGVWWFESIGATSSIRVRATAWTSGTLAVVLLATMSDMNVTEATVPFAGAATLSNVSSSASNGTVLSANNSRKGVVIFNDGGANLFLKYGATASTTSFTFKIPAGGTWEMPWPIYLGQMDGIADAASGTWRVTEIT